jgi:maltose/moltooligosaccharide transporter
MKKKPILSFWQIWNMSFGFLGIQFGFALQNANVSRIFQTLGGEVDRLAVYWLAAPVTGLIIQPIIGYYSDKTWGRLGRRRPYFLAGALFASLSLLFMPNSPALWIAVGMLWIMDASINISMEPFRAFVGDNLSTEQRTKGFAMQSFFIGLGAVVASLLPFFMVEVLKIPNVAEAGEKIPPAVRWSFYTGGVAFLGAVLWTIIQSKEYSPDEMREFEQEKLSVNPGAALKHKSGKELLRSFLLNGTGFLVAGVLIGYLIFSFNLEKELYILSGGLVLFGCLQLMTRWLIVPGKHGNGLTEIMTDIANMPKTMKQLAVVQFFSWFALFSMWIYTTPAVTRYIFGATDTASELYNKGANWVGVLFGIYNGFAAAIAFLLPVLARRTSRKITHSISLAAGSLGLLSFYLFREPNLLILSMIGIGLAWASILSMPYSILTESLPAEKMGVYMGIFNFFIVIPQILAASLLGFMMRHIFGNQPILALVAGGVSMALAAFFILLVTDTQHNSQKR